MLPASLANHGGGLDVAISKRVGVYNREARVVSLSYVSAVCDP